MTGMAGGTSDMQKKRESICPPMSRVELVNNLVKLTHIVGGGARIRTRKHWNITQQYAVASSQLYAMCCFYLEKDPDKVPQLSHSQQSSSLFHPEKC